MYNDLFVFVSQLGLCVRAHVCVGMLSHLSALDKSSVHNDKHMHMQTHTHTHTHVIICIVSCL